MSFTKLIRVWHLRLMAVFRSRPKAKIYSSRPLPERKARELFDRQGRVSGVETLAYRGYRIIVVGCGGIGVQIAFALVMKGIAVLILFDRDRYDLANGNRQMCLWSDLGKNKAVRLGRKLVRYALAGSRIICYPLHFDDVLTTGIKIEADLIFCGVDNNKARLAVSDWADRNGVPCIHIAVDTVAESFSVFVQRPSEATLRCAFPNLDPNEEMPCRVPSVIDPIKSACGYALYALDAVLQDRPIGWNLRIMHLAGFAQDGLYTIERQDACQSEIEHNPVQNFKIREMGMKV